VKARVLAGRRADVGVRVDPYDRQVVTVPAGQLGKGRDAYRALPAEGSDPRRIVRTDDLQGSRELPEDDCLGLDAVALLQALVAEGDGCGRDGTLVRRQGQLLECVMVRDNNGPPQPVYTWAFPTQDAFIAAVGPPNSSFAALEAWFTSASMPLASPSPSAS
jgi:hypothetical protein